MLFLVTVLKILSLVHVQHNFFFSAKEVFSHLKTLITESSVVSDAFKPTSSEVK